MSAFLDETGTLITVSSSNPLPVAQTVGGTEVSSSNPLPTTIADGDDVAIGAKSDTAATDSTSSWSLIALAKAIFAKLSGTITVVGHAADGTSPTNPSVLIGAKTPAGLKKTITADNNGCLYTRRMIVDTTGAFWFDPDSCSYTLNKNSDGTISTEVYVDPLASKTYTKTYTTTSTQITATGWVAS